MCYSVPWYQEASLSGPNAIDQLIESVKNEGFLKPNSPGETSDIPNPTK